MNVITVRRAALAAAVALGAVVAAAGPASAHASVTASEARALAKNVTLTFTSEAESRSAGIATLQVVLPTGISPGAVSLKKAPEGWKLSQAQGGYLIGGKALAVGTDAVYSIVVDQLPDAKSLVFKTVETYGDGKVSRWIDEPGDSSSSGDPAPALKLKSPAPGATREPVGPPSPSSSAPTPSASKTPPQSSATPSADASAPPASPSGAQDARADRRAEEHEIGGDNTALNLAVIVGVVLIAAGTIIWVRRRRSGTDS